MVPRQVAALASRRQGPIELLPVLLAVAVYSLTAAGRAIADADEGVYVHIPQQMLARADWLTPYVNGVRSLDKPPLLYWLIALSYTLFGQNEFAARIPSIASVCGTSWLVQRIGTLLAGPRAGVAAGLAFAFSIGTFLFTLEVMHDVLLVFFLTLAMYCVLLADRAERPQPGPVLGLSVALAGAFLAKGLLGLALPAGAIAAYAAIRRRLPPLRWRWLLAGGLLFAALALPWHVAMELRNPGFLRVHFYQEQILRFLGKREPVDYESVPLLLFWALVPVWSFPWSLFLARAHRVGGAALLPACWAGLLLVFFSVSSRLEHYAFPLLPPLAILAGLRLGGGDSPSASTWERRLLTALAVLVAAAALVLAFAWVTGYGPDGGGGHPERTHSRDFSILTDFPPELFRHLLALATGVSLALSVCLFAARRRTLFALTTAMTVFGSAAAYSIRAAEPVVSSKAFGVTLARQAQPGDFVAVFGDYETANSINFYAPVLLHVCEGQAPSLLPGLRYPDAPRLLIRREELAERWRQGGRAWLVARADRVAELALEPALVAAESAGRVLVTNQPPPVLRGLHAVDTGAGPPLPMQIPNAQDAGARLALPGAAEAENVGEGSGGIQPRPGQGVHHRVGGPLLQPANEVAVQRVFGKMPGQPHRGRNHDIHHALVVPAHAEVADGGVAQRAQLVKGAVGGAEAQALQPAPPVHPAHFKLERSASWVVMHQHPCADRTLDRMGDVVGDRRVVIAPAAKPLERFEIVLEEWPAKRLARVGLGDQTKALHQAEQQRGLSQQQPPPNTGVFGVRTCEGRSLFDREDRIVIRASFSGQGGNHSQQQAKSENSAELRHRAS